MYNAVNFSAVVFCILTMISCRQFGTADNSNLPVIMDDSSQVIIDRAIAYAGGYDVWQQKKSLSFDKKSTSYDSSGNPTRVIDMHLDYIMKPDFKAKLTYKLHDTLITLIHDGKRARKLYNNKVSEDQKDIDAAWNASFGSQFVVCIPYKLKDPGIKAEYRGEVQLAKCGAAQVIKTTYAKGAGSNSDHIWYYYFEPGTGKLLANSFNGKDNYWDYTSYDAVDKVNGLLLPAIRRTYAANALNKPGKLITENRNTNIALDKEFTAGHFEIPE